jgi:hypothetical protein
VLHPIPEDIVVLVYSLSLGETTLPGETTFSPLRGFVNSLRETNLPEKPHLLLVGRFLSFPRENHPHGMCLFLAKKLTQLFGEDTPHPNAQELLEGERMHLRLVDPSRQEVCTSAPRDF